MRVMGRNTNICLFIHAKDTYSFFSPTISFFAGKIKSNTGIQISECSIPQTCNNKHKDFLYVSCLYVVAAGSLF